MGYASVYLVSRLIWCMGLISIWLTWLPSVTPMGIWTQCTSVAFKYPPSSTNRWDCIFIKCDKNSWKSRSTLMALLRENTLPVNVQNCVHHIAVIMGIMAYKITSLTILDSIVYSVADQRKHESSVSLVFVLGPVNSAQKGPVTRKMFPYHDVIMGYFYPIRHPDLFTYLAVASVTL